MHLLKFSVIFLSLFLQKSTKVLRIISEELEDKKFRCHKYYFDEIGTIKIESTEDNSDCHVVYLMKGDDHAIKQDEVDFYEKNLKGFGAVKVLKVGATIIKVAGHVCSIVGAF